MASHPVVAERLGQFLRGLALGGAGAGGFSATYSANAISFWRRCQ